MWDVLVLILILFECVTLPMSIAFALEMPTLVYWVSMSLFALDMCMSFNTGYFIGALLVMRRQWLAIHYIGTWFFLDLVSTFPWELVLTQFGESAAGQGNEQTFLRILKLSKLMRVLRLLRVAKVTWLLKRLQSRGLLPASLFHLKFGMSIARMFCIFFILSHWSACVWGWLGDSTNYGTNESSLSIDTCALGGPCEPGIVGSPWRRRYAVDNYDAVTQYIVAMQFSVACITGQDFSMQPGTAVERVYTAMLMICSVFVTSVVVGEILLIMNRQSEVNISFEETMQQAREFMSSRAVPTSMQSRVYRYLEAQHGANQGRKGDRDFMGQLSNWLYEQLVENLHSAHLCKHPFFMEIRAFDSCSDVLRILCLEAKPIVFTAGDPVVEQGHTALCAHFLVAGKICVILSEAQSLYLMPPCWIGDTCLFVDTLRTNTVVAVKLTETLAVQKTTVQNLCAERPEVLQIYNGYRTRILEEDAGFLRCPRCGDIGHAEESCQAVNRATERQTVRSNKRSIFSRKGTTVIEDE
jgi:hypothetical protein